MADKARGRRLDPMPEYAAPGNPTTAPGRLYGIDPEKLRGGTAFPQMASA